jgi:hypothetical protein
MKTNIHFWSYLAQFFLEWENFRTKGVEQIKTHMLSSINFFSKIMPWKNTVEPDRPQKTIWRMGISWSRPKATNTNSEFSILIALPLQQWLHERAWMFRYTYIACVVCYVSKPILFFDIYMSKGYFIIVWRCAPNRQIVPSELVWMLLALTLEHVT